MGRGAEPIGPPPTARAARAAARQGRRRPNRDLDEGDVLLRFLDEPGRPDRSGPGPEEAHAPDRPIRLAGLSLVAHGPPQLVEERVRSGRRRGRRRGVRRRRAGHPGWHAAPGRRPRAGAGGRGAPCGRRRRPGQRGGRRWRGGGPPAGQAEGPTRGDRGSPAAPPLSSGRRRGTIAFGLQGDQVDLLGRFLLVGRRAAAAGEERGHIEVGVVLGLPSDRRQRSGTVPASTSAVVSDQACRASRRRHGTSSRVSSPGCRRSWYRGRPLSPSPTVVAGRREAPRRRRGRGRNQRIGCLRRGPTSAPIPGISSG